MSNFYTFFYNFYRNDRDTISTVSVEEIYSSKRFEQIYYTLCWLYYEFNATNISMKLYGYIFNQNFFLLLQGQCKEKR